MVPEFRQGRGAASLRRNRGVGRVVYGNIGSLDRLDFTVVGPTVNFASRLETAAKQLGKPVICSLEVARELPASQTRNLGPHALKGISDPQTLFEVEISTH
jgi:adenylate cyclase